MIGNLYILITLSPSNQNGVTSMTSRGSSRVLEHQWILFEWLLAVEVPSLGMNAAVLGWYGVNTSCGIWDCIGLSVAALHNVDVKDSF